MITKRIIGERWNSAVLWWGGGIQLTKTTSLLEKKRIDFEKKTYDKNKQANKSTTRVSDTAD